MGIVKLKEVAISVARILNAVSAFVHKQGLLSLYPVIGEAQKLVSVDWIGVKAEVIGLDQAEGDELELAFKSELKLQNPAVQVKIGEAIDCVQESAQLVGEGLSLYGKGKALVVKLKALVSA